MLLAITPHLDELLVQSSGGSIANNVHTKILLVQGGLLFLFNIQSKMSQVAVEPNYTPNCVCFISVWDGVGVTRDSVHGNLQNNLNRLTEGISSNLLWRQRVSG